MHLFLRRRRKECYRELFRLAKTALKRLIWQDFFLKNEEIVQNTKTNVISPNEFLKLAKFRSWANKKLSLIDGTSINDIITTRSDVDVWNSPTPPFLGYACLNGFISNILSCLVTPPCFILSKDDELGRL